MSNLMNDIFVTMDKFSSGDDDIEVEVLTLPRL